MTIDLALVLLLLAAAIFMFVTNRPRMDVVAVIMIVLLPFTGVITVNEALAGFSDPAIVLIAALFVIGEGLVRTGVARRLGDGIGRYAGNSETRLLVLLMLAAAGLGATMSSTAVVAIFIPVVLRICQNTGIAPGRLMMPLSVAALISGMLTLVATTPNLIVNGELMRHSMVGFGFFAFTPFGLPILALGILYMLAARRFLPVAAAQEGQKRPTLRQWVDLYQLSNRAFRIRVQAFSPLIGRPLESLRLRSSGVNLLGIERSTPFGTDTIQPRPQTVLRTGDILLVDAITSQAEQDALCRTWHVDLLPLTDGAGYFTDRANALGMAEAIVPANSPLIGRTVLDARVRSEYDLTVIGLRRGREIHTDTLLHEKLRVGDTLLLSGFWPDLMRLRHDTGTLVLLGLPAEEQEVLPAANQAPFALAIMALVVLLMISGLVSNVHAALIGCLLMGVTGCVDMNSAYRSISWKSLVLIVGMLPFSLALQRTGGVDLAADALVHVIGEASPRAVLGTLFLITMGLGLFISNTATAVLMAPVALAIGKDMHASPYPFAMTVALAASTAFMTPISSPVNTLVVGPGNYAFGDFVKLGVPFSIIVMAVCTFLIPILLPF